ncbi:MAG: LodA/GoxA family CTQ-dependent oxidase [Burkholderiales bacterium]
MALTTLKIFPPIGIARLGDSPEFFIGPERPGDLTPPTDGYRDASCRIKRQGARFRLYAYDENGQLMLDNGKPKEITLADGAISWTVELANTKASWQRFVGHSESPNLRNASVANRATLEITPGARTLNGPNQAAAFNTGQFLGKFVALGDMHTDTNGRCIVVAGHGTSGSVPAGLAITNYANNDGWHDDVADGPVKATAVINGQTFVATPAWVICAAPKFAPSIQSITSLYDMLAQVAVDNGLLPQPALPSLTRDIFPTLKRTRDLAAVTSVAANHHGTFDLANPQNIAQSTRQFILSRLRNPNNLGASVSANMPLLLDDDAGTQYAVTPLQYRAMQAWVGQPGVDWIDDWAGPPAVPADITPDGLTLAALEPCVGGAFFPGIEGGWRLREVYGYVEPFRLDPAGRQAGDVTKQMAVPWQADFLLCRKENHGQWYGWWPAQRPDDVLPESGGTVRNWADIIGNYQAMVDDWSKLGFVLERNGQLVETDRRVVCRGLSLITDKSSFGSNEVAARLAAQNPATFPASLYVIAEGFLPAELGITGPNPTPAQLLSIAPAITFARTDGTAVPGMTAVPEALLMQVSPPPATLQQRFTFVYRVEFASIAAFSVNGLPVETQAINATATRNALNRSFTSLGHLMLYQQPNPYLLDGPVAWLSTDLRVFKVTEGDQPFSNLTGAAVGNTPQAALSFLDQLIVQFNVPPAGTHPFDTINPDPAVSQLELSRQVGGKRVFNFAVAKVRYRAQTLPANNVRVFFRLFTTAATGMEYDAQSTYRRTSSPTAPGALLGVQAGYVVTIPCFGRARVDTSTTNLQAQTDDLNVRNLSPAGANESIGYFGCWLDFNQTEAQFPRTVNAGQEDGQWAAGRLSIQELIRGQHQCLVAEVWFDDRSIDPGTSPASSESLAQRNLVIAESDNPGGPATHTVQHTFEIKATSPQPTRTALLARWNGPDIEAAATARSSDWFEPGPDELMIRWGTLPRASRLMVYVPDLQADQIIEMARRRMDTPRLVKVDDHTLECEPGDVTYIPLPEGRQRNSPALLTVTLPDDVQRKQLFDASVHQVSGFPRAILGAFQVRIPVSDKALLLEPEVRKLSVLRHIARAIPLDDPWHAVFRRYLDQVAARVDGFGGDSTQVAPSPDGTGRDEAAERCRRNAGGFVLLLALTVLLGGLGTLVPLALLAGAGAWWFGARWWKRCAPGFCRLLTGAGTGLAIGAGLLAVVLGLGLGASWTAGWWALCMIAAGAVLGLAWWRNCLALPNGP